MFPRLAKLDSSCYKARDGISGPIDGDDLETSGCHSPKDGTNNSTNVHFSFERQLRTFKPKITITNANNLNWTAKQIVKWAFEMVIVSRL